MIKCYVNGAAMKNNACFAVHLQEGEHKFARVIPLRNTNANTAELKAVHFALLAVRNKTELELNSSNRYVVSMLERSGDGQWKKNAKANADLIGKVRSLLGEFSSFSIVYEREHELMKHVQQEARKIKSLDES